MSGEEPAETVRIAIWSGPRNLSTALMRSFGNRPDCAVVDEPFYGPYLILTGVDHPMRAEVLRRHPTDWREVAEALAGPAPEGKALFCQKHMTHHMVPAIGRDWMRACRHAFLIRHPARVLASYAAKRDSVELRDIGFAEQAELFDVAADLAGRAPPVIDADALLTDAPRVLQSLCDGLGIRFDPKMLAWPAGPRPTDGAWAPHWYEAVNRSTGFEAPRPLPALEDAHLARIADEAMPIYLRMAAYAVG